MRNSHQGGREASLCSSQRTVADDEPIYRWNPEVACQQLAGTAYLLLDGRMLELNPTGSFVWNLCRNGATLSQVADALAGDFAVDGARATADAQPFFEALLARRMLVEVTGARAGSGTGDSV